MYISIRYERIIILGKLIEKFYLKRFNNVLIIKGNCKF